MKYCDISVFLVDEDYTLFSYSTPSCTSATLPSPGARHTLKIVTTLLVL